MLAVDVAYGYAEALQTVFRLGIQTSVVPRGRFELPRPKGHWILNPARLPVPPPRLPKAGHPPLCLEFYRHSPHEYNRMSAFPIP